MKSELLNGVLTINFDTVTATIVQDIKPYDSVKGQRYGFYMEISRADTDQVLDRYTLKSIALCYSQAHRSSRSYKRHGFE